MRASFPSVVALLLAVGASVPCAVAQPAEPAPTSRLAAQSKAAIEPADQHPLLSVKMPEEARKVIRRALEAYAKAQSYQDTALSGFTIAAKDAAGEDASQDHTQEVSLAYERGGKMALKSNDLSVYRDGNKATIHAAFLGQYVERDAAAAAGLASLDDQIGPGLEQLHPVSQFLAGATGLGGPLGMITEITAVKPDERDGKKVTVLMGLADAGMMMPGAAPAPVTLAFSDETGLLTDVRIDFTQAYAGMMSEMVEQAKQMGQEAPEGVPTKIEKAEMSLRMKDIRLDQAIDAAVFAFKPDAADKRVDEFDFDTMGSDTAQQELVGKPAPEISGVALDGAEFSLSGLKGKVVLLDFWATWCGPCVQSIPSIQGLSDKFKGKAFVVVGINQDGKGTDNKVKKFLEKRSITFTQFMDEKNQVGRAYHVTGIPCSVLVDQKGNVQRVHVGASPTLAEELGADIQDLLDGKQLSKDAGHEGHDHAEPAMNEDETIDGGEAAPRR
ncbi:MAG: TlpA family protein disulfide reductase [Phycisphaerales bacterium]|nr:TlpA family protein disulfide reductase [Phycisphaerales bacterium]